jgi:hypothetical protein
LGLGQRVLGFGFRAPGGGAVTVHPKENLSKERNTMRFRKMQKDAERCRKMQKDAERSGT